MVKKYTRFALIYQSLALWTENSQTS